MTIHLGMDSWQNTQSKHRSMLCIHKYQHRFVPLFKLNWMTTLLSAIPSEVELKWYKVHSADALTALSIWKKETTTENTLTDITNIVTYKWHYFFWNITINSNKMTTQPSWLKKVVTLFALVITAMTTLVRRWESSTVTRYFCATRAVQIVGFSRKIQLWIENDAS